MHSELELNSSDHFQLLFDYKIKKEKGTANTSQLLIELETHISKEDLHRYLLANKHFKSLVNTTIVKPFFGRRKFRVLDGEKLVISELILDELDPKIVFQHDDIGKIPVKVTLIQLNSSSAILFQFNHVYIDNNGARNLLFSFERDTFDFLRAKKPIHGSFFKRLKSTIQLSKKMMYKWYKPKAFIHSLSNKPISKDYIFHTFTDKETGIIKSKIHRSHHIESISSLLLSSCCLSIKELLIERGEELNEFVFQQPFDLTPKKEVPYILGNRFSFIHYRLLPEQVTTLASIENEINKQTSEQIKTRTAHKFLELQSVLKLVGNRLQLWMMSLPAKGKMTSFAYTFIGESKYFEEFAGQKVMNIVNIPPVMRKPPVTFGFTTYDSNLIVQIHFDENALDRTEAELIINKIKSLLLAHE